VAQSPEEHRRAIERHGMSPVAWLDSIGVLSRAPSLALAHVIYASDADLRRLADSRHHLVYCPFSQLVFGFPAPAARWTRGGLRWVVATDCASNNDSMSVQKELRHVAGLRSSAATESPAYLRFVERGAPADVDRAWAARSESFASLATLGEPATLLAKVWSIPGAMHPGIAVGTIAPGALANLVVWDLDHPALWPALDPLAALTMSDPCGAMHALWVAGRRIGADGDVAGSILRSRELADARREAQERLARLL
jgi:5-methylthioadenosine/S-adenosylhomocysteine deaminase